MEKSQNPTQNLQNETRNESYKLPERQVGGGGQTTSHFPTMDTCTHTNAFTSVGKRTYRQILDFWSIKRLEHWQCSPIQHIISVRRMYFPIRTTVGVQEWGLFCLSTFSFHWKHHERPCKRNKIGDSLVQCPTG